MLTVWEPDSFARGLRTLAMSLLFTYVVVVLMDNYPLRLLDPVWGVNLSVSLVDNAFFALVGVGLAQLAVMTSPDCNAVQAFARRSSSLALLASLVFLLLIPLQVLATVKSEAVLLDPKFARIEYTRNQLERLRRQVAVADNTEDLQEVLRLSQGFSLPPEARAQPFDQLQATLLATIDAARQQLPNTMLERAAWRSNALQRSLRVCLTALLTAIGFAALGRRRGSDTSAIDELVGMIAALRGEVRQSIADRREEAQARRTFREEIRLSEKLQQQRILQDQLDRAALQAELESQPLLADQRMDPEPATVSVSGRPKPRRNRRHQLPEEDDYFQTLAEQEPTP